MKLCLRCNQYFEDGIELCPIDSSQLEGVGDHPLIGALINDRYVVDSVIGKGSTGIVYKATRLLMGSEVAVKVLHSYLGAEAGALDRFLREARAASRLRHPHIINIWEFGATDDGQPYFVMDYLEGMTLADMIKRQGFIHPMKMMPIIRQVCDALNEAHTRNIIHRDIKPENIVLQETDYERGQDFVKVLDFGIADQPAAAQGQKRTKMAAGSPAYMSPEQCQGFELDQRSDIYSLGIVVFEMLTGERPFVAEDVMNLFYQHVSKPPPAMGAVRPDVKFAPQLEAVVAKALAKKPGLRHASVKEFQKDLEEACKGSESGKKVDSIPMDLFSVPLGEMLTEGLTSSGSSPAMSSGNAGARKIIGNFLPGPEDMIDEPEPATAALPTAKTEPPPKPAAPAPPVADYQEAVSRLLKSAKKASDAVQTPGGPQPAPEGSSWAKDVLTRGPESPPEPPKDSGVRIIPTESYRSITRSSASNKPVLQPMAPSDTGADLLGGPAASQPAAKPAPPATPVSPTSEAKPAAPTATKSGGNPPAVPPAGPVPEAPEVSTWAQRVLSRSSETEIPGGNGPGPSFTAKPPLPPAGQQAAKPLTPGGDKAQSTPGAQPGQQAGAQAKQQGWPAVAPGQSQAKPQPGAPGTTGKPGASGTQSAMPGTPGARAQQPGQAPGAPPQAVRPGQGIAPAATSAGPTVPSSTGQRIAAQTSDPGGPQPGPGAQKGPAATGPGMMARPAQGQAPGAAKPGAPQSGQGMPAQPGQGMKPAQAGTAASGQGLPAQPGQGMKPAQTGTAASGQGLPAQPGQGMKPAQTGTAAGGQGLPAQPGQGMKPAQAGTAASGQGLPAQPGQAMKPAQTGTAASGQGLPAQPGQGMKPAQAGTAASGQGLPAQPGQAMKPAQAGTAASGQGLPAQPGQGARLPQAGTGATSQSTPVKPGQPTQPQPGAPAASNQGMSALPGQVVRLGASVQGLPPAQPGQPTKPQQGAAAASNQGMSALPGHVVRLGASTQGMPPAQPGQPTKPAGAPVASNQGMSALPGHVVRLGASVQGLPPVQPGQGVKPPQQTGPAASQGPTAQPGQLGQSGQTGPTGVQRQGQGQPQTAPGFPGQRVPGAQQTGPQMSGAGAQPGAARPQQQGAAASGGQGIASQAGAAPKPGAAAASSQGLPGQQQRTGAPAAGQPLPGAQRAPGAGTPSSSFEPPKRPLGPEQKPAPPAAPETQPQIRASADEPVNTSSGSPPSMPVDLNAEKGIGFDVPPTVMAAAQASSTAKPDAQIEQAGKLKELSAGRETGFIDLPTLQQSAPSSQAEHASDVTAPAAAEATASGTSDSAGEGTAADINAESSEKTDSKSALAQTEALSKLFPFQTAAVAPTDTADVSSDFTPKTGVEQSSSLSELVGQPPPGAFSFAPNPPSPFVPGAGPGTAGDTAALQSSDSLQGEAASPPGQATPAKGAGKDRPKGFGGMAQAASRLLGSFNKGKDKAAADTSHTSLPVPAAPPEPAQPQMTLQERLAAAAMAGADKASANAGVGKSTIAAAASADTSPAVSGPGSETQAPASGADTTLPVPGSGTPAPPPGAETTSPAAAPAQAAFAPPPVPEPAPPASSLNAEPDKTGAIPSKFDSSSGRPADALNPFANAVESMLDASRVPQKPLGNDPFARSPEQTPVTSSSEQPSLSPKTDFAPPAEAEQPALAQPAAAESGGASAVPTSADPLSPIADKDEEGEIVKHSPPVKSWDPKRFDRPINRGSLGEPSRFDAALDKALDTAIDAKNKRGFDSVRSDHPLDTALDAGAIIDPMRKSEAGGSRSSLIKPFADKPAMQTPASASQEQPAIELPESELPRSLSSQFTGGAEPKSAFNIKRFEDAVANPEKPVMDVQPGAQTDTASQEKPAFDPKRFEEPVNRGSEKINTFANAIDTLLDSAMMKPAPLESREQHETGMIDASIIRSYVAKPQSPQEPSPPPVPKAEPFRVSEEEVHAATEDVKPITLSASAASTADGVPAPGGPDDKLSDAVSRLIEAAKRTPEPEVTSAAAKPEALNKKIEDVKKKIQALKAGAVPQPAAPTVAPPVAPPTSPPISANTGEASDAVNRLLEAAQSGIYQTVKKEPQSPAPPAQPPFTQKPNIKRSDTGMPEIKRPAEPAPASGQSSANWSTEAAARAADLVNAAAIKSQSQRVQTPDASDYYSGFKSAEKVDKMNKVEQRKKDRARLRNAAQMPPFWGWMLKLSLLILAGAAACYTFHIDLSNYNPFTKPQSVKTTAATFEDSLKSGLDDAKSFLDKKKTTPKLPQAELEKVYDEYLALAKKQAAAGKYVDAIQSLKNIPRHPKDRYRQAQSLSRTYKDKI